MEQPGASAAMATIDEEMAQLEKDIRQLKIEYDQYFGGGRKRPPTEIEWRIELIIKRYGERGGDMKFGQRFRYNNLSQTYAKYKDIFVRSYSRKKRESAAPFRRRRQSHRAERRESRGCIAAGYSQPAIPERPRPSQHLSAWFALSLTMRRIRLTSSTRPFSRRRSKPVAPSGSRAKILPNSSAKKTKELQTQKSCREVEYVVEVVNGEVKLKALVKLNKVPPSVSPTYEFSFCSFCFPESVPRLH